MRYIVKDNPPQVFEDWKSSAGPRVTYKDLNRSGNSAIKDILRNALIEEQFGLCCYCGISLEDDNVHIEHFMPQSKYPGRQLDYENLHASCLGREIHDNSEGELEFCGHSKQDWYDPQLTVSPLDSNCESYFTYGYDGTIDANQGNQAAKETITKLGLDTYLPIILREAAIDAVLQEIDLTNPNPSEIDDWISFFQTPIFNKLPSFSQVLVHILKTLK